MRLRIEMNGKISKIQATIVCMIVAQSVLLAQVEFPGELTTDELNIQRMYIEASQAKLMGSNEDAAEIYHEIMAQDPQNHAAAYEYSRVLYTLERYREGLDQIDVALRYGADNPWYWLMKADILEVLEDYAGAIEVYARLTELKPEERYYYLHQVDLLLKSRQPEQALVVLDQLEENRGIEPEGVRKKVEIYDILDQPGNAVTELEKLLLYYPDEIEFLHLAALYAVEAGDNAKAASLYARVLELDPDDAAANLYSANQLRTSGADTEYLRSIIPLIQNSAIDVDAKVAELLPYIEEYAISRDPGLGQVLGEVIDELVTHHPDEAKAHALYGDYLYNSDNPARAIEEYEKTLVLDKSVFTVWEQLMYLKAELHDMDGLLRTSEQALNVFPNQGSIYYLRGLAYAYKEDFETSIDELQQALIMSGRNKELRFHVLHLMGQVYLDINNAEKAYQAFDKALEIRPDDLTVLTQYSMALVNNDAYRSRAVDMAKKADGISPGNPQVEHILAMLALANDNIPEARKYIEKSMDHGGGDDPLILEHYGDILFRADEVDEAVEYWQLSLESGNPSPTLKRKIAERKLIH